MLVSNCANTVSQNKSPLQKSNKTLLLSAVSLGLSLLTPQDGAFIGSHFVLIYLHFFPSQDDKGQIHQVWYDDPQSICPKADYVTSKGLRGIGMWNGNILDYSDEPVARQQTAMMWNALLGC